MKKFSIRGINFSKYDLVIFDLDNTLYSEKDYLFQVYRKIADYTQEKYGISSDLSYIFFINYFIKQGRINLFDTFFEQNNIDSKEIETYLHIMRTITLDRKLELYPLIVKYVEKAQEKSNVCIVTNGNPIQQRNKVAQIDWKGIKINKIYYANELAPKPSNEIFKLIKEDFSLIDTSKVLMLGDSIIDRDFAINIGADFINVKK